MHPFPHRQPLVLVAILFMSAPGASAAQLVGPSRAAPQPVNEVSGEVWLDADRDGLQGVGEPGVAGVRVKLLDAYGRDTGVSRLTGASGRYVFRGMADGVYRVAFERPPGRRFTRSDVGSEDSGGTRVVPTTRPDDSDLNLVNGYGDPALRGPHETGMRYFELTRLDGLGQPWPINMWAVYPAAVGSGAAPRARVRDLYLGDDADRLNNVATSKLATSFTGGNPDDVTAADPDRTIQDIEARIDAPVSDEGPFPVVIVVSGLLGSAADMVEIGDWLASHGYVALCTESSAFHASLALGGRLAGNGGSYVQSDFDHVPQVGAAQLATLMADGYQPAGYLTGNWTGSPSNFRNILAADSGFVLDLAEAWNELPGHPFESGLELAHVGWYGYSAGARYSGLAVRTDPRIAFLINCDSSGFVNVPKPMMWVGNQNSAVTQGPSIEARLPGDFHPHYFFIPAIDFDPPSAAGSYHREYHHDFRNAMITAFCGYYLKDALAYREDLGLDGKTPLFDGYVTPYVIANQPGWHSPPFHVEPGAGAEIDAGLVDVRLWVLENHRLSSLGTGFLPAGDVSAATCTDHGDVLVDPGGGLVRLPDSTHGLALDADRSAWFLAGTPPTLYALDLAAIEGGAPVVATPLGTVAGLPSDARSLTYEPRGSRLLAVAGARAHLYAFPVAASPLATDLGPLPASVAEPSDVDLDLRGRTWIADADRGALSRISPGTGQPLGALGTAGLGTASLAYDEVSQRLLVVDGPSAELLSLDPESGQLADHGSLAALGFGPAPAIAFERRTASRHQPSLRGSVAGTASGAQPLLDGVSVDEPAAGWEGSLLHVQIAEGTGDTADLLTLDGSGSIALGANSEVDLPELLIGEAREILWNGARVAWLENDWGLAVGGNRLAPLRIAFTSAASAPAVAAVIEALRYTGPLPRRFELELVGADGRRNLAEIVELTGD